MTDTEIAIYTVVIDEELKVVYVRNGYITEDAHDTGEVFHSYTEAIARAEKIAAMLNYELTAF